MNKRLGSSARPVTPCLAPAYGWITTIATFFSCRVISSYPCAAYEIAVVDVQSTQTELLQQSWWCEKSAKASAECRFNMFSMFNQMVVWQDLRPTLRPPWITTIATFFSCRVISSYPCAAYEIAVVDVQSTQTELLQQSWWCEKSAKASAECRFNINIYNIYLNIRLYNTHTYYIYIHT